MANDNVRSGPAGATKQASKLGHRIVKLNVVSGGATVNDARALTGWTNSTSGGGSFEVDRSANDHVLLAFPGSYEQVTFGGEWIVGKIWLQCTETFADTNQTVEVGIYSINASGTVSDIDTDAICTSQSIPIANLLVGATYEIPMDGVGAGLEYYTTAAPASNTVSMKLGIGTAQFDASDASKAGQTQFLGVKFPTVAKGGKAVCYVELIPVGGSEFKN